MSKKYEEISSRLETEKVDAVGIMDAFHGDEETPGRSYRDYFFGNDADELEDNAMDAARDVFGHAVELRVRRSYRVNNNPMFGRGGVTSLNIDKKFHATVIVDEVVEDTEKKQCHFNGCVALFDPELEGFEPGDGRASYSGWVIPLRSEEEGITPDHEHEV